MDESVRHLFEKNYEQHWYFSARAEILAAFVDRFTPIQPAWVIGDFGAATGMILARLGAGATTVALEEQFDLAKTGVKRYDLRYVVASLAEGVPLGSGRLDMALMLDVLEHLDDDRQALREVHRTLRPGGILVVTVPAFQGLWSRHDELHHHRRRYSKRGLLEALASCGFTCERVTYFNTLLFPLVAGSRFLERAGQGWAASSTDYDRAPARATGLLRWVFSQERLLVRRWRLPIGVSLLVLARRASGV